MVGSRFCRISIFATVALSIGTAFVGCGNNGHPDERMAIYNSLDQQDLRSVTVSQDRDAGVITLSGIVASNDRKQAAEQLARQAAPGYNIINHIQIGNAGLQGALKSARQNAQLDSAIEDHFKAQLAAHQYLKNIQYSAYNGTLTLKGTVRSYKERQEAEALAKRVPQVQHVVNDIQISNAGKPSPDNAGT